MSTGRGSLRTEYRYRLGLIACGREVFVGETLANVTVPGEFRVFGLRPNPASGELKVALSVSGTTSAILDLLDLSGRQVLSRDLGVMAPGNHVVPLTTERPLAAGVYFVRLREGSRSVMARGVVIR